MIVPLRISFRNIEPSEAVEARVREEVTKLETFYEGIIRCRVVVELPHKRQTKGGLYHVLIDLTVPGGELVVKHEPSLHASLQQVESERTRKRSEAHAAHKDIYVVIRDAFKEARRRLQDYAQRERRQTKLHASAPPAHVTKLFPNQGYGFLETSDSREIYFHRNSVLNKGFGRLKVGSVVRFSEEMGEKGPQASTVAAVD
jgi:cold shock CspA family protein/ribosome-associated translation inhibitor RaiA